MHYVNYAVDYDGDGRRDLLRSPADVIGSTANYIASGLKWRRGEPWLEEIKVPPNLPWEKTDLTVKEPRSTWAQLGVTYPDGRPLPNDNLPASVLLPMGRFGPAFMAYANFAAYTEWNNSLIYSTTAGYLASRIAGAAPMRKPAQPVPQLPFNEPQGIAAAAGARRLQCRQGRRRAGPAEPRRREGDAGQVRPAGGFLADRRAARAHARRHGAGAAGWDSAVEFYPLSFPAKAGNPVRRGVLVRSQPPLEYWIARSSRAMTAVCAVTGGSGVCRGDTMSQRYGIFALQKPLCAIVFFHEPPM